MTAANELDAALCQESVPDEFSRLTSSSPDREKPSLAFVLSGIIPVRQLDGVMCPRMLRRHLLVPAWRGGLAGESGRRI